MKSVSAPPGKTFPARRPRALSAQSPAQRTGNKRPDPTPSSQGVPRQAARIIPALIANENELDSWLTQPRPPLVDFIKNVSSPLLVLGAGGKMGPTLAVLAQRAAELAGHRLKVIAVSRFADSASRQWLESRGVATLSANLLDRRAVQNLPEATNIIYLVGLKFGTKENPALTWAVNTIAPALVAERYPAARLVALSTGNVYPMVPVRSGGATEGQSLTPLGEYANAAVARERVFEYFAQQSLLSLALIRLNYAVELRYGVLVDIAQKVFAGEPVDVTAGYFNCIWQGDANEMIIRALALARRPPAILNLTGPTVCSVRIVAEEFARRLRRPLKFVGKEAPTALLSNPVRLCEQLGEPATDLATMIAWIAEWLKQGGRTLNRPTHFEVRDGKY